MPNAEELKISLVIPAYNEEGYIKSCLEYAINSSGGKFFEIIVVDNNSNDRTGEIAKNIPGVRVVYEPRKGLTLARQRGFREAGGDIIAYIDADTRMPEGWYETVLNEFKKNPRLACLSGPYLYYDIPRSHKSLVRIWNSLLMPLYLITRYMVIGGNFAIRRAVLEKMDGFDTSIAFYGEDVNIARRAHKFGKVKFKPGFVIHTSGRRFFGDGLFKTAALYGLNLLSEVTIRKPVTKKYTDVR